MNYPALLTDFYQLSMAYHYWQLKKHEQQAVFHVFFRRNPLQGSYVVSAGLSDVIAFLQDFHFSDSDIHYLRSLLNISFSEDFLLYLKNLRFTGDIDAVAEGSVVFAHEPLLRIKAPLILCQLLETALINQMNFSSAVATLASRMRTLVGNDVLFEFGLRRAQGPNGGMTASRSAYLGGFDATSNVLAGQAFDIPIVGTMSHSWVMAFENELAAFQEYARLSPHNTILLVDTYHTVSGIDHAITVGNTLKQQGYSLKGIRLDSGDLQVLSQLARDKLDSSGFQDTKIYVSGDLCEKKLATLTQHKAPIDGWGVGTNLSTSYDQPTFDMVYKLSALKIKNGWDYKMKCSDNAVKSSDPGLLQVRRYQEGHRWAGDVIYLIEAGVTSPINSGETFRDLLFPIFKNGECIYHHPTLTESRLYCMDQVKQFSHSSSSYEVKKDPRLIALKQSLLEAAKHEKEISLIAR